MKIWLFSALFFLVSATGSSAFAQSRMRIGAVGDSQLGGLYVNLRTNLMDAGFTFDARYRKSTTAAFWANNRKLAKWLKSYDPQAVIVVFGTNEGMSGLKEEDIADTFQQFIDLVGDYGRRIVFWAPPPRGLWAVRHMDKIRKAVSKMKGVITLDFPDRTYGTNDSGAHLTGAGYWGWAKDISDEIRKTFGRL